MGSRNNHLKVVILWFGAWKHTYSTYVPAWVKTDTKRFTRVQHSGAGRRPASPSRANTRTGPPIVGIGSMDEEDFQNGVWTVDRRLNGDESSQAQALRIRHTDLARGQIYKVRLYRYR
jgi:hypothetical protein